MYSQQRLDLNIPARRVHKVSFGVWQKRRGQLLPWYVQFVGYSNGKGAITIYHAGINDNGRAHFGNLHLETPGRFADFTAAMLGVHKRFGANIDICAEDIADLRNAYRKGVQQRVYDPQAVCNY